MVPNQNPRLVHILNFLMLVFIFALAIESFDRVPDPMPVHYDLNGNPDRWAAKSMAGWLVVPFIALGNTIFMYLIGMCFPWLKDYPHLTNLPKKQKEKYLTLTPEQRLSVLKSMQVYMYWFPVTINMLFVWFSLTGEYSYFSHLFPKVIIWWPLGISMFCTFFVVFLLIRASHRTLRDL